MAKGRKKLPTEVKQLSGTLQKCRTNPDAPSVPKGWPEAPTHWRAQHKKVFQDICAKLETMKVLAKTDKYSIILYVDSYVMYLEATKFLRKKGLTYTTISESGISHRIYPQVGIRDKCWKQCYDLLAHFGFSPSTRQNLKVVPEKEEIPEAQKRYQEKMRRMS